MTEQIEWGTVGDSHAVLLTRSYLHVSYFWFRMHWIPYGRSGTVLTIGKNGRGQAGQPETEQTIDQYRPVAIHEIAMLTSSSI